MKNIKINLTICLLCTAACIYAGDGTMDNPYTVSEMKAQKQGVSGYVGGYIVGVFDSHSNDKDFYQMSPDYDLLLHRAIFSSSGTYLIADNAEEVDIANCLSIQFPTVVSSYVYNLYDHPLLWRKYIEFFGTHNTYKGRDGLTSITDLTMSNVIEDETVYWTFFEDFEEGAKCSKKNTSCEYIVQTLKDENNKWAGSELVHYYNTDWMQYYDDSIAWSFNLKDALVDDGKPKWDDKAVSIRHTGGYIELTTERKNGIGEIEFFAANYEDYKNKTLAFSVQYSVDKGKNWIDVVSNQQVGRATQVTTNSGVLYRYKINSQLPAIVRITKTDANDGCGLQIDNLKMSDYHATTGINSYQDNDNSIRIVGNTLSVYCEGRVEIYDVTGRLIYNNIVENFVTIPMQKGMYILNINGKKQKIII